MYASRKVRVCSLINGCATRRPSTPQWTGLGWIHPWWQHYRWQRLCRTSISVFGQSPWSSLSRLAPLPWTLVGWSLGHGRRSFCHPSSPASLATWVLVVYSLWIYTFGASLRILLMPNWWDRLVQPLGTARPPTRWPLRCDQDVSFCLPSLGVLLRETFRASQLRLSTECFKTGVSQIACNLSAWLVSSTTSKSNVRFASKLWYSAKSANNVTRFVRLDLLFTLIGSE